MNNYHQLKDAYEETSTFKPIQEPLKTDLDWLDGGFGEELEVFKRPTKIVFYAIPDIDWDWLGEQFKKLEIKKDDTIY